MTHAFRLLAMAAVAAVLAPQARGQAKPLRYSMPPGTRRVLQLTTQTETLVTTADQTARQVIEVPIRREILVIETKADPAEIRVVIAETPSSERLVAYEKNGTSQLAMVPESKRTRTLPPLLAAHRQDTTGRPLQPPPKPKQAMEAIDYAIAELRYLPIEPLAPKTPATRQVDLGVATLTLTTEYAETARVGTTTAAVLDTTGQLVFKDELGKRITVHTLNARSVWALDGSGLVSQRGTFSLTEKAGEATQKLTRTWEERLEERGQLTPDALATATTNLGIIEKAMTDAQANQFDEALKALEAYVAANPKGAWTPAVRNLQTSLAQRKVVSQPVQPSRLRLMLRDLQARRDQAGARGGNAQVAQFDRTIRQVVAVNAKQILMDAADPDPIVRDLATFGLAFLDDPQAVQQLQALVGDPSSQVRGTALVSLAIRAEPVKMSVLKERLADEDARTRGAAALLARSTIKPDDPATKDLLPAVLAVLSADLPWARNTATMTLLHLAPKGNVAAAGALIQAYGAETEQPLKTLYLAALRELTDVEADAIEPYQAWLKEKGGAAPAAPKPAPKDTPTPKG